MTRKAIIYRRVSTENQKDFGTSLDYQLELALAYANSKGFVIAGDYAEDFSGATLGRPELTKAMESLRNGQADIIIVQNADRLDRSEWGVNLLILLTEFKQLDIELHYSEFQRRVNLDNPTEVLLESINGWKSGDERLTIVRRLKNGMQKRVRDGGVMVKGHPPYGYQAVRDEDSQLFHLVIEEYEAHIVRLIFWWYVYGDENHELLSINEIARRLNEMGITPPQDKRPKSKTARSDCWRSMSVARILKRETYIGTWHWKRGTEQHLTVSVDPIIDEETFKRAQERKLQNKAGMNNDHKYDALLRQRVTCGECGYKMRVKVNRGKGKVFLYYVCACNQDKGMVRHKKTCSNSAYFRVRDIDNQLWQEIKELLSDKKRFSEYLEKKKESHATETSSLQLELETIKKTLDSRLIELERVIDAYTSISSDITKAILEKKSKDLETVIKDLQAKKAKLVSQIEEKSLSLERLKTLEEIADKVRQGIIKADKKFEAQKRIIDMLNVEATLEIIDGKKRVKGTCELGELGTLCNPDSG